MRAPSTLEVCRCDDKYDDEKAEVGGACILGTGYRTKTPAPPCVSCCEKLGWSWPGEVDPRRPASIAMNRDPKRFLKILFDNLWKSHVLGTIQSEILGQVVP